jgi:transcription-repair coupling factor (superfamily II helicase)
MISTNSSKHPISPINPCLPNVAKNELVWQDLSGCADSLALAEALKQERQLYLIVTEDTQSALNLENEIKFFLGEGGVPVLHFPDWEILPYDIFSPLPEIVSERLRTFVQLTEIQHGILIVPVATVMQRLAPRSHVIANTFVLKPGDRLNLEQTRQRLEGVGYQCVSQVLQHGEFAVRGSIIDIFPMGSSIPYRIELFDEEIESLRTFDTETQRSTGQVKEINLFPAREFPFDEEAIKRFRRAFRTHFSDTSTNNPLYQDVSKGIAPGGIEYYLPLFTEKTETLFDYLPPKATVVLHRDITQTAETFFNELQNRYQQRQSYIDRPPLPPELLYLNPLTLSEAFRHYPRIWIAPTAAEYPIPIETVHYACRQPPQLPLDFKQKQPAEALFSLIHEINNKILFIAETAGHRESLLDTFNKLGLHPKVVETWQDFLSQEGALFLSIARMDLGMWITDPPLAIVTETQLAGERVQQRRRRRASHERNFEQILRNLEELEMGSPVVHQDHGVGRYLGLSKLTVGGIETEFLALEYANHDKLYVPVASLHLISRYSGASPEMAPLHKLGGEQWQKAKRKALERARDVAAELLNIYAKRAAKEGYTYQAITEDYLAFTAGFPFEETPDQENAILDVIKDMAASTPMDRVICGDVGFGKTEVAMRAAFIATQNDKQVAVLVPTTLLAQQHFQNFRDRFADWPIRIEVVSRFIGKKQQEQLFEDLKTGKIDILIGTHKILQKDIHFKSLGLAIIDEEHRFGVTQKEHFKKLRAELDFLTLTATPIPRTLNMAMAGLRDISIIATPPPNRHAIKTFISEWDDALIQEAILREIKRGGQVYFLNNKIEIMEKTARELEKLVPVARIRIAHGQMPERELERIMLDFYHQRFNVLLCTTIIESGIDVPSANTIIIQRADLLGLAQLHQIRGRVGRSHHRAYAYLLVPPKSLLTATASKRLEAIEASGELGAGFMLSSYDLEIRGAGELLGDEQSGQIHEVGLSLYTELLERAVTALKSGKTLDLEQLPQEVGPEIDLQTPALIPDTYLPDIHSRLVFYKKIANAKNTEDLEKLQIEMIDRIGLLPPATKHLFAITELKLKAERLGIQKIEAGGVGGRLVFQPNPSIDPTKVIQLIQTQPQTFKLDGPDRLKFFTSLDSPENKIDFVERLLERLDG